MHAYTSTHTHVTYTRINIQKHIAHVYTCMQSRMPSAQTLKCSWNLSHMSSANTHMLINHAQGHKSKMFAVLLCEADCHTCLSAHPQPRRRQPTAHLRLVSGCDLMRLVYAVHLFLSACRSRLGWWGHVPIPSCSSRWCFSWWQLSQWTTPLPANGKRWGLIGGLTVALAWMS